MALDEPQQTAAVASSTNEVEYLKEQIARLTEQVATLVSFPFRCNTEGQQCGRPTLLLFSLQPCRTCPAGVPLSPTMAAINSKTAVTTGKVGSVMLDVRLDSGSSVSLIKQEMLRTSQGITKVEANEQLQLVTGNRQAYQSSTK